jgi:hypothetical protein
VSSLPGLAGYRVIFIVSFGLFALAAALGIGLHSVRPSTPYQIFAVLPGQHRGWQKLLLGYAVIGLRDGIFTFAVNLLVFLATGGERSVGNFAFLTSVVGMGAFWAAGRFMPPAPGDSAQPGPDRQPAAGFAVCPVPWGDGLPPAAAGRAGPGLSGGGGSIESH